MRGRKPNYKTPNDILQYHLSLYYRIKQKENPKTDQEKIKIANKLIDHYQKELTLKGWLTEENKGTLKHLINQLTNIYNKEEKEQERKKKLEEWKKHILPVKSREIFR
jgi:hypothetical protein